MNSQDFPVVEIPDGKPWHIIAIMNDSIGLPWIPIMLTHFLLERLLVRLLHFMGWLFGKRVDIF